MLKEGDKARVVGNTVCHHFDIGEEVILKEESKYGHAFYCQGIEVGDCWRVMRKSLEPVKYKFKKGDRLLITGNDFSHGFNIGEEVKVVERLYEGAYKCSNKEVNYHVKECNLKPLPNLWIGDEAKITGNNLNHHFNEGDIVKVVECDGSINNVLTYFCKNDKGLNQLVFATNLKKLSSRFKKGDFVKGRPRAPYSYTNENMLLGRVTKISKDKNRITVVILRHKDSNQLAKKYSVFNKDQYFKKVDIETITP